MKCSIFKKCGASSKSGRIDIDNLSKTEIDYVNIKINNKFGDLFDEIVEQTYSPKRRLLNGDTNPSSSLPLLWINRPSNRKPVRILRESDSDNDTKVCLRTVKAGPDEIPS
jgi:hypothetical protein